MKRKAVLLPVVAMALVGGTLLAGCSKKDTEKPSITIVSPTAKDHSVAVGETLKVKIEVSDNEELSSLKLGIHSAADGHTHEDHHHEHGTLRTRTEEPKELHFHWSCDLKGKQQTVEHEISIPKNTITRPYHLEVSCVDKAGNEAKAFQDLEVK